MLAAGNNERSREDGSLAIMDGEIRLLGITRHSHAKDVIDRLPLVELFNPRDVSIADVARRACTCNRAP